MARKAVESKFCAAISSKLKGLAAFARSSPTILIAPLLLFAVICAVGIWGVFYAAASAADQRKADALSTARNVAAQFTARITAAYSPVEILTGLVQASPDYTSIVLRFRALGPSLYASAKYLWALCVAPSAVFRMVEPPDMAPVLNGQDIFAVPDPGLYASALEGVINQRLTIAGPFPDLNTPGQPLFMVVARAIFVSTHSEQDQLGRPDPPSPNCGEPCAYRNGSTYWGMAVALIRLLELDDASGAADASESPLQVLRDLGYAYTLTAANGVVGYASASPPRDPVEAKLLLGDTYWVLRVSLVGSWTPSWLPGAIVGVVLAAIVAAALLLALLISRRRHQALLEALLPKSVLQGLHQQGAAQTMAPRSVVNDSPAELLHGLLDCLTEGTTPDLRDVVLLRSLLLQSAPWYSPVDVGGQIRNANLESDVEDALMRQLAGASPAPLAGRLDAGAEVALQIGKGAALPPEAAYEAEEQACSSLRGALALVLVPDASSRIAAKTAGPVSNAGSLQSASTATTGTGCGGEQRRAEPAGGGGPRSGAALEPTPEPGSVAVVPAAPTAPLLDEVERLLGCVDELRYDTWALAEATGGHALSALGFYLLQREGLLARFSIAPVKLIRLLHALEAGYPASNPYHNATHAADVLRTLHVLVRSTRLTANYLDPLGLLAAYFAAIVHDHGHPGLTGDFLVATSHPLALRYNDRSPLESHHASSAFTLLAERPELDVLSGLSKEERTAFRKQVIEMVMATDMKQHFALLGQFEAVARRHTHLNNGGGARRSSVSSFGTAAANGASPTQAPATVAPGFPTIASANTTSTADDRYAPMPLDDADRTLSLQMALKCADIGHLAGELSVHKRWLAVLEEEFFRQGDQERELGLPISPLFDRAKQGVSKSQVGFFDFVALPLLRSFAEAFPGGRPMLECFESNYRHWQQEQQQQQDKNKVKESGP